MVMMDRIADFIYQTKFDDIPDETVSFTRHLASKIVAAMLVGANTLAGKRAVGYANQKAQSDEASAMGTGRRFSLEDAVFINGITCHAAELEDDQFPSATSDITIFPVAFPLAESLGASGQELLTASSVGIEVMHRIGRFPLSSKGITDLPFYGVIGAAATAAKLMGLEPGQIKSALGIAMGRAGGYIVNFGTDAHYIESAGACQDGLMAARLAGLGMSGSRDLEAWIGHICQGTRFDAAKIVEGLGEPPWRVHETWVKKYPCCFLTHRHIDMILEIASERAIGADDVERIDIHVGPVDNVCNRPSPIDTEDARFSFHHIMAAILVDGDIDSHHFTRERLGDERLRAAWGKTRVTCHEDWPAEFMSGVARIEIGLKNGGAITRERVQARGGPDEPLSQAEVELLYRKYTRPVLAPEKIDQSWEMITKLERLQSLDALMTLLG